MPWASWASAATGRHAGGTAAQAVPLAMQVHKSHGTSSQGLGHHGLAAETCHTTAPGPWVKRSHLLTSSSWTLAPLLDCLKHWVYIWAAYANYLKGELGGDENGKYLAVMCDAALWIIQLVFCEVFQADGLSWMVLGIFRKNSKTYVNSDDLYCI